MSGKYSKDQERQPDDQIVIEVQTYLHLLVQGAPKSLLDVSPCKDWLLESGRSTQFVQLLVMTLPSPRHDYYQSSNYDEIQFDVLSYSNAIIKDLGLYPITTKLELLKEMQGYSYQVMFIGLAFDVIVILFVIVAILLIYSLLLISVETKTFEIGIMRMVGLSKTNFVVMIGMQALLFVLPSVVFGFACYMPCMVLAYHFLFTDDLGFTPDYSPGSRATL